MAVPYTHHYKATLTTPLYKEYQIIDAPPKQWITNRIQIISDDVMNDDSPEYWLHYNIGRKWSKKALSPLFTTKQGNVYHGKMETSGKTLIFLFSDENLTIYYYPNSFDSKGKPIDIENLVEEAVQK